MFCFKCGQRIADSSVFCNFCGADQRESAADFARQPVTHPAEPLAPIPQTLRCHFCGKPVTGNARFCDYCGTDQFPPAGKPAVKRPAQQPAPAPEPQPVSPPAPQPMQEDEDSYAFFYIPKPAQAPEPQPPTIQKKACHICGYPFDINERFCELCGADRTLANQNEDATVTAHETACCVRCKKPIANERFCSFCGADQKGSPKSEVSPFAQPPATQPFSQPAPKKKTSNVNMKILIPFAAALIVIIGVLAVFIGLAGRDDDLPASADPAISTTTPANTTATAVTTSAATTEAAVAETTTSYTPSATYNTAASPVLATSPVNITRTIMVYLVGSNLESNNGMATADLQEMLDANFSSSDTQVLVCTGGAKSWKNTMISADETSYYLVADHTIQKVYTQSEKNMGDCTTLSDFMTWCVRNYPAQRYSLYLWDHGGGPLYGYGSDERTGDQLLLAELVNAMKASPFNASNKLETIGFDACLMGSVETAWIFKDYADYYIASQELEPGFGWNYAFLKELPYCEDGDDIGKVIIDSYFNFYNELFKTYPQAETEITLSCIDLSGIDAVESELNKLFTGVNDDVVAGKIATASRCRYNSKAFGKSGSSNEYDLVDLMHLASLLRPTYAQAANLESALKSVIVYSKANVANANGLSLYHPYDYIEPSDAIEQIYNSFGFAQNYADYIANFMDGMKNGSKSNYRNFSNTLGNVITDNEQSDLSLQLTAEQMQTFSSAQYYVFWAIPADQTFSGEVEYLQVFSGQDVNVSADGKLTASYSGKAVFGKDHKTGEYSDCPLSMYQIYDGSLEEKFSLPCMFSKWYDLDLDIEGVRWLLRIQDGKPVLLNAYRTQSFVENFPDKQQIDPANYDYYQFANNSYFLKTDEDGNSVLEFTQSSYGFEYNREDGFSLELRPIEDKSQYRAVFLIEDIYGNSYYSAFIPLE